MFCVGSGCISMLQVCTSIHLQRWASPFGCRTVRRVGMPWERQPMFEEMSHIIMQNVRFTVQAFSHTHRCPSSRSQPLVEVPGMGTEMSKTVRQPPNSVHHVAPGFLEAFQGKMYQPEFPSRYAARRPVCSQGHSTQQTYFSDSQLPGRDPN